jgi:hypothetical protein
MVIAALLAFGALLAAWLLAPAERRTELRPGRRDQAEEATDVAAPLAEAA